MRIPMPRLVRRLRGGSNWLAAVAAGLVCACCLLLYGGSTSRCSRDPDGSTGQPGAHLPRHRTAPHCRRVYELSSLLHEEETLPIAGTASCVAPPLNATDIRRCLTAQTRADGRHASLLLIGDSRLRELYLTLLAELGVTVAISTHALESKRLLTVNYETSPAHWCWVHTRFCRRHHGGELANLEFRWRPFVSLHTVSTLLDVERACLRSTGRPPDDDCPHLVLLNAASWYSTDLAPFFRAKYARVDLVQPMLLLRRQLAEASDVISRLARLTRLVWKLDERVLWDMVNHDVSGHETTLVVHALVYELRRKASNLIIWSSALPGTTGFLRRHCYAMRPSDYYTAGKMFLRDCGGDHLHGPNHLRLRALDMLFGDICSEVGPLSYSKKDFIRDGTRYDACCGAEADRITSL